MAELLPISQLGDPVLRQIAQPIDSIQEPWVQTLVNSLVATLRQSNGVGIAAPQVGHSYRLLVVASHPNLRYPDAPRMEPTPMINPRLVSHTDKVVKEWEGCLSIPGIRGLVPRFDEIEVEYTTCYGTLERQILTGFIARIFQHEFDHLEGFVFLDRVETMQELMTEQEYLKRIIHR